MPDLLELLRDEKQSDRIRISAAKSLAELGDPEGLQLLYQGISSDHYMDRSLGNIGLKAISGRSLDNFEGYRFGEEKNVIGGQELQTPFQPIKDSEQKARRFLAIAAYSRWLRDTRPDVYRLVSNSFNRSWDFVGPLGSPETPGQLKQPGSPNVPWFRPRPGSGSFGLPDSRAVSERVVGSRCATNLRALRPSSGRSTDGSARRGGHRRTAS